MFMIRISLFFVCGYLIILLPQLARTNICNQANSDKIKGIYKTDNFTNDIAFGASLFVF